MEHVVVITSATIFSIAILLLQAIAVNYKHLTTIHYHYNCGSNYYYYSITINMRTSHRTHGMNPGRPGPRTNSHPGRWNSANQKNLHGAGADVEADFLQDLQPEALNPKSQTLNPKP